MRYLLDTCAMIWLGMGGGDLSADARRRISAATALHYSSISTWEIARLMKEGKVFIPNDAVALKCPSEKERVPEAISLPIVSAHWLLERCPEREAIRFFS